jgi:hypothetical protein
MPPQLHGKPQPLTRIVEPFVERRYQEDDDFRAAAASINSENSPNGRTCFDDRDMAYAVKEDGTKAGIQRIIDAAMGELSTAIKRVMSKRGIGRSQRIMQAKQALMLGSAQPAE